MNSNSTNYVCMTEEFKVAFISLYHRTLPLFHFFGEFADAWSPRTPPSQVSEPSSTARSQLWPGMQIPGGGRATPEKREKNQCRTGLRSSGTAVTTAIASVQNESFGEKRKTEYCGVVLQGCVCNLYYPAAQEAAVFFLYISVSLVPDRPSRS